MGQILWSCDAHQDLIAILDYFVVRNVRAAQRFADSLELKADIYASQPEMGSLFPEAGEGIRCFLVHPYVVLYRPTADGILILRIIYATRDIPSLM